MKNVIMYVSLFLLFTYPMVLGDTKPAKFWDVEYDIGGYSYDGFSHILSTDDAGFILTGSIFMDNIDYQILVWKIDENGKVILDKTFGEIFTDVPMSGVENDMGELNISDVLTDKITRSNRVCFLQTDVRINIYDIVGRQVKTWQLENQPAGWHEVIWNGLNNFNKRYRPDYTFTRCKPETLLR